MVKGNRRVNFLDYLVNRSLVRFGVFRGVGVGKNGLERA